MKMITILISGMMVAILFSSTTVLATSLPTSHAGVLGIDVSHWQGSIDWNQVAKESQVKFAFIKATEGVGGSGGKDEKFRANMKNAHEAGILVGPYHFARPGGNENPEDEAKVFLQESQDYIKKDYLLPALDVEDPPDNAPDAEKEKMNAMKTNGSLASWVQKWMSYIKDKTGQTPILYTNRDYYTIFKKLIEDEGYIIWISDPSTTSCSYPKLDEQQPIDTRHPDLKIKWKFWQWYFPDTCGPNKDKGPGIDISGIPTHSVDLDEFDGSERDLLGYRCDSDQGIAPTVQAFEVAPFSHELNLGEPFKIKYTVLDSGGSGLKKIELWRKEENGDWPKDPILTKALADRNGPISDSFTDSPPSLGKYWYGVHVVDNTGNWNDEKNSNSINPSIRLEPIDVVVMSPSMESCKTAEAESWFNKGKTFYDQNQYKDAIQCFDEAIKICQDYTEAWCQKGNAFFMLGDRDEAIQFYDEAIRTDPKYKEAWNNKGTVFHVQGKYDEAIQCYDEATKIDPEYEEAWYGKGHTLYEKGGNYDEALQCVNEAIAQRSNISEFWKCKGDILKALGSDEAQAAFDKADELESINKPTHDAAGGVSYD